MTFQEVLKPLHYKFDRYQIFKSFVLMAACTLSLGRKEELYLSEVKAYDNKELTLFGKALGALICQMEKHPYTDLLGDAYMEYSSKASVKDQGIFFTPIPVCRLMARMLVGDFEEQTKRPITVQEPATGSSRTILALIEHAVDKGLSPHDFYVEAWDISALCVYMSMINLSLWSIPARIIRGNTLSLEVYDTFETPSNRGTFRMALASHVNHKLELEQAPPQLSEPTIRLGDLHEQGTLFD